MDVSRLVCLFCRSDWHPRWYICQRCNLPTIKPISWNTLFPENPSDRMKSDTMRELLLELHESASKMPKILYNRMMGMLLTIPVKEGR